MKKLKDFWELGEGLKNEYYSRAWLNATGSISINGGGISLKNAKRLYIWLGKAIKYLEEKKK